MAMRLRSLLPMLATGAWLSLAPSSPAAATLPGGAVPATPVSAVPMPYADRGPFRVGVTSMVSPDGRLVEVWYPATPGPSATDTYDLRAFVPPAIRALLTASADATLTYDAARDAPPADGRFPLVLFSHGFMGMRLQSTFLTAHLASWGMVVASPEHASRDLFNVLGNTASGERADSVTDLLDALQLVEDSPVLGAHVDGGRVAAVGHSAGGATVAAAAADPRIDGYVSMASGLRADPPEPAPAKPSFFLAGDHDGVVSPDTVTRTAFGGAALPTTYWLLAGVGHNGFDDFCTLGGGTGIIGVAEQSGLGPLLDAQPRLRLLGEDGCKPPNRPVTEVYPIIRHGVTAWLRHLFGVDAAPTPMDAATLVANGVTVADRE